MPPGRFLTRATACLILAHLVGTAALAAEDARARNLINSLGCKGCHLFEGSGGSLGPSLDRVGQRLTADQIREKLIAPRGADSRATMPAYSHLDRDDLEALVDFLARRTP